MLTLSSQLIVNLRKTETTKRVEMTIGEAMMMMIGMVTITTKTRMSKRKRTSFSPSVNVCSCALMSMLFTYKSHTTTISSVLLFLLVLFPCHALIIILPALVGFT